MCMEVLCSDSLAESGGHKVPHRSDFLTKLKLHDCRNHGNYIQYMQPDHELYFLCNEMVMLVTLRIAQRQNISTDQ